MTKKDINPYFAINLSLFFPGLGQIYSGEVNRGLFIVISQVGLILYGNWHVFAPGGHVLIGIFILFFAFVIHSMGLLETYERLNVNNELKERARNRQSPWLAFFFSQMLPGIGHGYSLRWWLGLPILISWIVCFRLIGGIEGLIFGSLYAGLVSFSAYRFVEGRSALRFKKLYFMTLFVSVIWFVRLFIPFSIYQNYVKPFYIPSESMEPVLYAGDRILSLERDIESVKKGELVLFRLPAGGNQVYLKRLVALGGDSVLIQKGRLFINSRPASNPEISRNYYTGWGNFATRKPYVVPPNTVFLLGDNSKVSIDSRIFGPVPVEKMIGKAYKIFWPPKRIGPL